MSDVLLSVGLQTGSAETSQIQHDLQEIISRIDKNPPKVKVGLQVDQSAINHFKSQLTQIVNSVSLSSGTPITVNISGIGEITAQANNAKMALDGVAKAGKQAADAVNKMNAKQSTDAITKINQLLIQMQANYAKWTAAQSGGSSASYASYGKQIEALIILKGQVDANAISAEDFATKLSQIRAFATDAAAAIKAVGEDHTAKQVKILTENSDAYNTALGQTESLLAQVKKRQEEWTAARNGKSSGAYKDLDSYRIELESLIRELTTSKMSADEFAAAFNNIKSKVRAAEGTIKSAGENTKTLGDRLKGLADKFGAWLSVSQVIMQAIRAIKQMVTAVREVDTAMTELKKVTDETNATYDKFLSNAGSRAKKVGATISDVVTATADFARLGYDIDEASTLADTAILYKNIGDGIEDISSASESIISTMQAFGIESSNAMSIVDKFNEVGNNFAISSAGIGEAMRRSAAAMDAANNTIDETIALITAANTIVQDPDSVGTTMKTISMYLRAAKTEAEEAGESTEGMANSVSELRQEILDLTGQRVDIQIDEDNFKSTYQILQELSQVWESLTDVTQANLLEMIGGKRNSNVVSALLENFSVAEEALKSSIDSAGSAMAENEKHLDSINGKIEIFKAAFEELAINFISSDFIKGIVDFGTGLVNILSAVAKLVDALGGLNAVLYVTAGFLVISKYETILTFMSKLGGSVIKIIDKIGLFNQSFSKLKSSGVGTLNALSQALNTVGISASNVQIVLAAVATVIGIAVSAYNKWKQAQEEARQNAIKEAEEAAELSGEISELTIQYIELSEAVNTGSGAKESLIETQDTLIEKLGLEQYEIDKLIEKYGDLSTAILNASKDNLQMAEFDIREGVDARTTELLDAARSVTKDIQNYISMPGIGSFTEGLGLFPTDEDYAELEKFKNNTQAAFDALKDAGMLGAEAKKNGKGDYTLDVYFDLDSTEGIIDAHERLGEMLRIVDDAAGQNNAIFSVLNSQYNQLDDAVGNYTDSVGELNRNLAHQYVLDGLLEKGIPETQEEFDVYRQGIIDAAVASGDFIGSTEQVGSAIDDVLKSDVSFAKFYTTVQGDITEANNKIAESFSSFQEELNAVNSAISEQSANGSIALETYNSLIAASSDYASCIEYENGYMQLNADKARELIDAKTQLQILELERSKIDEAENYRRITQALEDATDSDEEYRASLEEELEVSGQLIQKYRIMQSELAETLSAYSKWKDAQNTPESGDMYDDTITALEQIQEGIESGKVGTAKYKTAVEFLIPEVNRDDVSAYVESLKRYISEDITGVSNFVSDAITQGLMVDDGSGNITIVSDATIQDFCEKLKITPSMAQAIFGELEEYGWEFDWTAEDFIGAVDPVQVPTEVDMTALAALQDQLADYRAQLAALENDPLTLQADVTALEEKISITEQAIVDAGGVVPVDTTAAEGSLQAVQEDLDQISEKADIIAAKVIGDMGASETVILLQDIINKLIQIDNKTIRDKHYNVYQHTITNDSGASSANGTSYAKGGKTLVGEFGPELVVSDNSYYVAGANGAEFVNLKSGDMVFNHVDTKKIMDGKEGVRGQALWTGARPNQIAIYDGGGGASNTVIDVVAGAITGGVAAAVQVANEALKKSGISGGGKKPSGGGAVGSGGGAVGSGGGGSSGSTSKEDDQESWFERQYKDHQHLVEMDRENTEDYLDWLDDAYKKAYEEGIIDLDEYYKYEEEVYKGRQDLFKDYINDIDHDVSLLEAGVGNSDEIINLYLQAMQDIEKELDAARDAGLDENGDYIQWLEQQWMNYSESVTDLREQAETEAQSSIDDLVEYRIEMLKQEIQDQKDALSERLDDLQDFYDKQRKMLQDQYDEEKYLEEQKEKRKSVTDIQADLAMLENDNSAWAQKRKLELQEQLADAQKELDDFEKDYALDNALDMLDEQQAAQEAQIQAEIDALDAKLNDPHALFNQALEDIKNNTAELYKQFIEYNRKYGTGDDRDIEDMWEEAYKADLEYQDTHNGQHMDGIEIGNYTGYKTPPPQKPPEGSPQSNQPKQPDTQQSNKGQSQTLQKGSSVQVKKSATHFSKKSGNLRMASFVPGSTYTVYETSGNEVLIGRNGVYTGWINKSDIVGYASGTKSATAGLHTVDELGAEYIFESPSDGTRYRMFHGGEKVLNAEATNFLYDFATSGGSILTKMLSSILNLAGLNNIIKPTQTFHISTGDINVSGSADMRTVSEIRRAQRENIEFVIKEFNKLNK